MPECGLLNLASCLPETFFRYLESILNSPIRFLLSITQKLLSEPVNLSLFSDIWAIILYMISMFYALLLIYSGFVFITSGHDSAKRENAKSWLRNIIIMIILIQASYFLYSLIIDLAAIMTSAILSLIDPNFFRITIESLSSIGLSLIIILLYLIALALTIILLIFRYVSVLIGVVLFPIAIFFYFIPPLKQYGSLILNFLGINIFITFFDVIILIGFSKLLDIPFFYSIRSFVAISSFLFIDILMIFLLFFSIIKAGFTIYLKGGSIIKSLS